jgi:predicted RNase H-like nuclease
MELLAEGQSVAIDMLFAPDSAFVAPPHGIWREIQASRAQFLSTRATAFVRYCRQQANRFGIKGSRVAAARKALKLLAHAEARLGTTAKLLEVIAEITALAEAMEHLAIVALPLPNGGTAPHFEVCDKKIPFTASLKTAREIVERLVGEYGSRALQAERNEGVDWKALSHAVRVGREAVELFETGAIVFPLRSADRLLQIKRGALPYQDVATEIETLLEEVEAAAARSRLPREPRLDLMEEIVASAYRKRISEPGS